MLVSKKIADLKPGDLVAPRDPEALEKWVAIETEAVELQRVGVHMGFVASADGEVLVRVQWLGSPVSQPEDWRPSRLMRLSN